MWGSRVELRVHYATCRSLAYQINEFMANQHSFDLSTLAAGELNDMVAAMIEQLGETENRWDKVARMAKIHGPDDPNNVSLLKDWYNFVHIKAVFSNTISAIDQYNFPNSSPRYGKKHLPHLSQSFGSTSTNVSTEDELDDFEDESTHSGISHSSNGTRHCHTCGTTGKWHMPQDCPAASRVCRQCSQMGHLAKACPIGTHLTIPQLKLAETTNKVNPHSAYGSDTESSVGTKSLATADNISTTGSSDNSQYDYAESNASQDSVRSQRRQATYNEWDVS